MNLRNPDDVIQSAKRLVEANNRSEIKLNANGGNSILILCEPGRESDYIKSITKLMTDETYEIIDLNKLLNDYVQSNKEELAESFELLKGSLHQIFKAPEGESGNDLFSLVINKIAESMSNKKIPVMIHSGALYGSGIDNIHIMENALVMKASLPLIILYPATKDKDTILFLGKRPASKYRCMIVE
ncbi:MAG TPA: hypothetical protein DF296_06240 [Candidatus Margulisbacteria bacterium]|nr:MAG: hypothetical protein A2X43_08515 [Candidatus Margulisbacteria bacterium GWD2_39_127]OGI05092.1 MAG: hypothetical protein A2X42_12530 [Candidatus Margulisbacteria bacterium GWF2_38_17]OGI09206.1 MAG: hypothetical protein A2X41_01360 [Candidatus Margulisbacteria bacterium GWE2_39_32]HAR63070.1 hypothetical protein [Candidatus Margulisiibacteriota bacterium]HCT84781.1 hypothetical protein [Candidatus Margulisiibacteriota bacterium]